ncbi:MAG: site-specific DNA-methyltransferase [Paludibacteraceae bacterium]|nr:site-specific DNA-methyltransferase [Paludibacteraceae bacterium]
MTEQEYLQKIHELEKQVLRLQTELKKNSETQYGLRWMDVPEAFEAEAENAIPTLEEVPEKAISNDDGKPTHILIEGDNFHALTCLNYTHKGQIDVIYIDPPYNTGSDGFVYKDKRVLDKFPDGTTVPTDHPLRHSYWLSFMHKRLELAKNLLSNNGLIFISIGDDEYFNLKLLCDHVFGEKNFIETYIWNSTTRPDNSSPIYRRNAEFILCCAKVKNNIQYFNGIISTTSGMPSLTKLKETIKTLTFDAGVVKTTLADGIYKAGLKENGRNPKWELVEDVQVKDGIIVTKLVVKGHSYWATEKKIQEELANGTEIWIKSESFVPYYKKAKEAINRPTKILPLEIVKDGLYANTELNGGIFNGKVFDNPKPSTLIEFLINFRDNKDITVLDFFGGSGTTMHATMQLNEEDGGHRQCILVQQNENNICEAVTYERNKRVMQGYTNAKGEAVAGLGNSMKYYRTAFVGEHKITDITDADKVALTQKAGCLLALGENTLEEIKTAKSYQIFQLRKGDKPTNDFGYTAVYFSGNLLQFADFRREIEQIQVANPLTRIAVYVFTWGDPSVFENEFDDLSGITIKPIPQPILEIYQNIHQL